MIALLLNVRTPKGRAAHCPPARDAIADDVVILAVSISFVDTIIITVMAGMIVAALPVVVSGDSTSTVSP